MKLSLRKANALQNAIQDHIKTIDVKTSISLNEFQDEGAQLVLAENTAFANSAQRTELTKILYSIRKLIGRANVESGVADLLSDAACCDKELAQLKQLTDAPVRDDMAILSGKIAKLKEADAKSRVYGYNDSVQTGVFSKNFVDAFTIMSRNLKKHKQSINDEVLALNVRTEIELAPEIVEVLRTVQLL